MKANSSIPIITLALLCVLIGNTNSRNIGRNRIDGMLRNVTRKSSEIHNGNGSPSLNSLLGNIGGSERPGSKREIPKFMLNVFHIFDQDHSLQPTSNIIRSFHNVAPQSDRETFNSVQDKCKRYPEMTSCRRKYLMLFNVSKIPIEEKVTRAELRFRYLSESASGSDGGSDVDIKVDHIDCEVFDHHANNERCDTHCNNRHLIRRRAFTASHEGWLTFDLTHLLRKLRGSTCFHRIEVDLRIVNRRAGLVRIDNSPTSEKKPLLAVFSDDSTKSGPYDEQDDLKNLIAQEQIILERELNSHNIRQKRSARREKRMDIQMEGIKIGVKQRIARSHNAGAKSREKRSSHVHDSCHRVEMEMDFAQLGYHNIHTPRKHEAYKCVGLCTFPIHRDATHHAIYHATMHFRRVVEDPPCCVPTKLSSISVLFYDAESDVVEYVYNYPDMTVEECGCR